MRATAILVLSYGIDFRDATEECEQLERARREKASVVCRMANHEAGVLAVAESKAKKWILGSTPCDDADGFTRVCLGMPRRMYKRYEHLCIRCRQPAT